MLKLLEGFLRDNSPPDAHLSAAVHTTGHPEIEAAFLIDPVDMLAYGPLDELCPSAIKALEANKRPFAIVAANITGACSPCCFNSKVLLVMSPAHDPCVKKCPPWFLGTFTCSIVAAAC